MQALTKLYYDVMVMVMVMDTRVSQEFFQTMATPKFSAFGYLNMEFIEKNKIYQI